MLRAHAVYCLLEPDTREKRYVGYTNNVRLRVNSHYCYANSRSHRSCWIRKLKREGLRPLVQVLCYLSSPEEAKRVEIEVIRLYRDRGVRLINSTDGGEGVANPSPERRASIVQNNKRMWADPAKREEMTSKIKASMTPERRAQISAQVTRQRTGTKHKPETIEKMKASWTEERKLNNPLRGRKRSPEVCKRISESKRGKPRSEETKTKVSATRKAKFASGEYEEVYPRTQDGTFMKLRREKEEA